MPSKFDLVYGRYFLFLFLEYILLQFKKKNVNHAVISQVPSAHSKPRFIIPNILFIVTALRDEYKF